MKAFLTAVIVAMLAGQAVAWDIIRLAVPDRAHESTWRDALADKLHGTTEVYVTYGRVDVLTATEAIELDFAHKYHESLGQALHYAHETGKVGVIALIFDGRDKMDSTQLDWIEALCNESHVRLIVLIRKNVKSATMPENGLAVPPTP